MTYVPVSSEISDLSIVCQLFSSQSKGITFGVYFFDVSCVNLIFLVRCQINKTSYSTGITITQGSPTWCPRAPGRLQGPSRSPVGLF